MHEQKTILVVDDDHVGRSYACGILKDYYHIIEAKDGEEALKILRARAQEISLVLLDIVMPVLDGFGVLDAVKDDPVLSTIPIVVVSSADRTEDEVRCLKKGAADFVRKPYNADVLGHRIAGILRFRESAFLLNILEYDKLTGLYSKEFFYSHAAEMMEEHPEIEFDIVCSDIENFKMVNERYGNKKGDETLRYLAERFRLHLKEHEICGRIGGDVFAFLMVHREDSQHGKLEEEVVQGFAESPISNLVVKFGVYEKVDRSISVQGMFDRAKLAMDRIKNHYGKFVSYYDDSLRLTLLKEKQILDNMEQALKDRQFKVYYQPKHNIETGAVAGAEALVRWTHPELGFMSPGDFIPLFEKSGFITKLDSYVWEEVCRTLQRWKKEKKKLVPVSVNVSRADFEVPDLAQKIEQMVDRYGLEHELLHLEVTESAYAENPRKIIDEVESLREMGFKVEMDDFGSGYSSLSMLGELSIDILKLDMKFVQQGASEQKKGILRYVINLSKWMNLAVIAEGVETKEQVESLKRMGCHYAQGYFYAKPMPADRFEGYLEHTKLK